MLFFVAFHDHFQAYLLKKRHCLTWSDEGIVAQIIQECIDQNIVFVKPSGPYVYNKYHLGLFDKITTKLFPLNTPLDTYFSFGKDRPTFLMVSCD